MWHSPCPLACGGIRNVKITESPPAIPMLNTVKWFDWLSQLIHARLKLDHVLFAWLRIKAYFCKKLIGSWPNNNLHLSETELNLDTSERIRKNIQFPAVSFQVTDVVEKFEMWVTDLQMSPMMTHHNFFDMTSIFGWDWSRVEVIARF